jgi:hypothetical protein
MLMQSVGVSSPFQKKVFMVSLLEWWSNGNVSKIELGPPYPISIPAMHLALTEGV